MKEMKRISYLAAALTVLAGAASCDKNTEMVQPQQPGEYRQVIITAGSTQTKTSVSAGVLTWSENDKLNIVPQSGLMAAAALDIKSGAGQATGTFQGQIDASVTDATDLYGWCGGNWSYNAGSFSVDMPASQTHVANGLAQNAYPSIGTGSIQDGITLSNPMGVLKLTVKGETTELVKSITITSAAKNLAGAFTVVPSSSFAVSGGSSKTVTLNVASPYVALSSAGVNFYVVVPPAEYAANDLTVTVTKSDDNSFSNTFADAVTVTAGNATGKEVKDLPKYICFEALEAGSTIDLQGYMRPSGFEYSIDGGATWADFSAEITLTNVGDKCYFKTKVDRKNIVYEIMHGYGVPCNFKGSGKLKLSGNIMALLNSVNPPTTMTDDYKSCFQQLFQYNENVSDASELVLPATTLAENCYNSMFSGCTKLEKAPSIYATTLATNCCNSMFYNCVKLTTAPPALLAADLAEKCFYSMFDRCSTLVAPPVMAAKTLGDYSCQGMFADCQLLTSAPDLSSVTTVGTNSCDAMFARCLSLTVAPALTATTLGSNCYHQMFVGCTSLTAAPALPATTLAYGCYDSMFDGCTNLTTAPILAAQTLEPYCYSAMFSGCSKLSSVTMLATDGFDTQWCLNSWLNNAGPGSVYVSKDISDSNKTIVTDKSSGWTVTKLTE